MDITITDLIAALGVLIGGYYVLVVAILDNLNFLTFNPSDYTRLKYDLYSLEKHRKNKFYITLAMTILTGLILYGLLSDFKKSFIWTIVIMIVYTLVAVCIEKRRNLRVLTIQDNNITWYLHLRVDDGYLFSPEDNSNELEGEFEVKFLKIENILNSEPKYKDRI